MILNIGYFLAGVNSTVNGDLDNSANCPDNFQDWSTQSGLCHKIFVQQLNWTDSELLCKQVPGGHLATIHSSEENKIFEDEMMAQHQSGHMWIGLKKSSKQFGLFKPLFFNISTKCVCV